MYPRRWGATGHGPGQVSDLVHGEVTGLLPGEITGHRSRDVAGLAPGMIAGSAPERVMVLWQNHQKPGTRVPQLRRRWDRKGTSASSGIPENQNFLALIVAALSRCTRADWLGPRTEPSWSGRRRLATSGRRSVHDSRRSYLAGAYLGGPSESVGRRRRILKLPRWQYERLCLGWRQ